MKRAVVIMMATILSQNAAAGESQASDWVISPGERAGKVTAKTTEKDLIREFGPASVINDPGLRTGTGLIPFGDPGSMLDITWCDKNRRVGVCEVRAAYGRFQWVTKQGLRHDVSLAEVEKLAGAPLMMEPGGEVLSAAGAIHGLGKTLFLTFKPTGASGLPKEILQRYMFGPKWKSSDPSMQPLSKLMRLVEIRANLAPSAPAL